MMVYKGNSYAFKHASQLALDAQECGERIELIQNKHGKITPQLVLDDARKKASPLHDGFEWDDTVAAEQHRLNQARFILRQIVIVSEPEDEEAEPTSIRAFVSVSTEDEGKVYMPLTDAMENPESRQQIVSKAYNELQAWSDRYKALSEFGVVRKAIAKVAPLVEEASVVAYA